MFRYVAFAWNDQIHERRILMKKLVGRVGSRLPDWTCAFKTRGLRVYHVGATTKSYQAYVLQPDVGVVLGKVFNREMAVDSPPSSIVFSEQDAKLLQRTRGRQLIDTYWGRYVAMVMDEDGQHIRILRDPTGAVPCFVTQFGGIEIMCSHIEDSEKLGLLNRTVNWDHVAAFLWHDRIVSKETGFKNVRQLQAGECATLGSGSLDAEFYWNPATIHDARIVDDHHLAMQELRKTIRFCVGSWAYCYSSIAHELSGGLDSSVVLACISRASTSPDIVCENYFTEESAGDERSFARKAASQADVELIETPLSGTVASLESKIDTTKVASPTLMTFAPDSHRVKPKLFVERGVQAVFTGQGGDHFFESLKTPLIAADYAWHHGLRPELMKVVMDTSRFTRKSVWSVLAAVFTSGLLHRSRDPYDQLELPRLVSDATRDALSSDIIRHPWIENTGNLPNGKISQIFAIIDSQNFFRVRSTYAERVHPLISQPIIELCLQIPSYVLTYGGVDRALVRDAFAGMVPAEILARSSKGGASGYFNSLFTDNIAFLREYLLDGMLVRQGILDKTKMELSLTESALTRDVHLFFPVHDAIRAESWLRAWIDNGKRAAA